MRVSLINLNLVTHDAIGQCIHHQARFFRRRGDEVQIYVMHPPQNPPADLKDVIRVVSNLSPAKLRSDLYIYHYPGRYGLIESMKQIDRGAVMFYYHNITPPKLWGNQADLHLLYEAQQGVTELTPYADLIVTPSPFNATDLVENYGCDPERVRVLPLAVPLEQFSPQPKNRALLEKYNLFGRSVILFVARMAGNKRPDLLVEALPLVQQQRPNTCLILVGDTQGNTAIQETVAQAKKQAAQLGVADDVIFTGAVAELPPYFHLADVYASASLHEGFGVPLIEAMASGVPVVASRATAHPWVVGEAGLLVEPENVPDLADKISQVLSDDTLYGDLVQRGLSRAREFSLEQYELNWSRLVNEATALLPNQPYPRLRTLVTEAKPEPKPAVPPESPSEETAEESLDSAIDQPDLNVDDLEATAGIFMHGYAVQSRLPILGSIIVWLRRNMTSHVREPYVDPMLRQQEVFNWQVVRWLKQLRTKWFQQHQETEARLKALEAEVRELRRQLQGRADEE